MNIIDWLKNILKKIAELGMTLERHSPSDILTEDGIHVLALTVMIDLLKTNIPFTKPPLVRVSSVQNTNSMDPVVDCGHNTILIAGDGEENQKILCDFIKAGDIAVYEAPGKFIIHRVKKIEVVNGIRYFTFRGDNNSVDDTPRVTDNAIKWLCVGVVF